MRYKYFILIFVLLTIGCQSKSIEKLKDNQFREMAWNILNESERKTVVGSKDDILYEDNYNTGVTTIINNSPTDVWRYAEVTILTQNEINNLTTESIKLKVKNQNNEIAKVSFKTLLGESSDISYEPIRIYIDTNKGKVICKENGKINGKIEF